jgi:DNA adenine methylase
LSVETLNPSPFLRWAGSKRWLVGQLAGVIPANFNAYFEPFLGSAAVFFRYAEGHPAHLSDVIDPLIRTYRGIRDQPRLVWQIATSWPTDRDTYYSIRQQDSFDSQAHFAARFLYLNRLCFNGLYRENSSGMFNVPYGRPRPTNQIADIQQLTSCASRLRRSVKVSSKDFESSLSGCQEGDFVYLDPPYVAGHRSNGFVDYNAKIFNWGDQMRLAEVFRELDSRGAYLILSNADHESVRRLYREYHLVEFSRHSSMSGSAKHRGSSAELVVLSSRLQEEVVR